MNREDFEAFVKEILTSVAFIKGKKKSHGIVEGVSIMISESGFFSIDVGNASYEKFENDTVGTIRMSWKADM